ncbi:hypothetical protein BRE01_62960 [Brevibacillus reuszeri]|uniref:LIM zinc-binding domain-containing protein n=1 Tax=Brevibacillus reuszeri TaxID=54915 RepID=A0ABQ0TY50_9BACL|nr:hypothetical protein [Brevibacillus reuszeri]GED72594.1 hypothetical protein BRE01_62960 [Brevibacillus reuszeri]
MRTEEQIFVSGDLETVHICDNCEEKTDDGRGYYYWENKDFSLCHICLTRLSK